MPELRLGAPQRCLRGNPLRLEAGDLGVRDDGIRLAARDVRHGGVELRARARDGGVGARDAAPEPVDLFARQRERRPAAGERNIVRPRVDDEEHVALAYLLVVPHPQLDDVPAHLGRDADEVGSHRGVVRLRPRGPLQQGDDDGDRGAGDDETPDESARDAPCPFVRESAV